jgi:hypothetical protein
MQPGLKVGPTKLIRFWGSYQLHDSFFQQHSKSMNAFPRLVSGLTRSKDAAWVCSTCAKSTRQKSSTQFFNPSLRKNIHNTSKPRQNVAPTIEQLRAPFHQKNASTLYYTISIILGTVAFSYGSVPMYKMVCFYPSSLPPSPTNKLKDLPNNRMGRSTD